MYLPNKDFDKYWACDIEGDDLPSNVVWCFCAVNVGTKEEVVLTSHQDIVRWFEEHKQDFFVFHNGIGYDAPTLNRLVKTKIVPSRVVDTMVLSMLYSPSLDGGHSLEAWGKRVGVAKAEFNDFSKLSDEMIRYCLQDCRVCREVFLRLTKRMLAVGFTETGCEIEHLSWALVQKQKQTGFGFDIEEAHVLYNRLRAIEAEIQEKVHAIWPPVLEVVATYKRPYKKDGTDSLQLIRHRQQYESVVVRPADGEYDCYGYKAFNIGSPAQRVDKLLELGWRPRPDERTPTGSPKPTAKGRLVPSLEEFVETSGQEGPRLIANWIEINARANMVNTWIEAYNEGTGCIHGSLWLANTLRYRHSDPNTANIPAVRVDKDGRPLRELAGVFTYEARALWVPRDRRNRVLVGVDAKGIQLRVLAHYLNNPAFTEAVLSGDPHSYNQQIAGLPTRAGAKTFIYAYLLGAGDAKIGEITGGNSRTGKELKSRFTNNFPGLADLLDNLQKQIDKIGRIRLCDGTPLLVDKPHTRLGYLLQGDESRIMKKASILIAKACHRRGLDVLKVGDIHDEFQFDVLEKDAEIFAEVVCPEAFRQSGEFFNYRLPIDCDSRIGSCWSETH